jgi:hypothetical protein
MQEDILAAIFRRHEAKAAYLVKPLDRARDVICRAAFIAAEFAPRRWTIPEISTGGTITKATTTTTETAAATAEITTRGTIAEIAARGTVTKAAAAGEGRPWKKRLSTTAVLTLKRARRSAAQAQ